MCFDDDDADRPYTQERVDEIVAEETQELNARLSAGRHYLMGVQPELITVEDALEAFGFGRNGLGGA